MTKIVLELQQDALDSSVEVISLLRKAYLVARKLQLSDFEEWVNSELNGYKDGASIPAYRHISGELKGWNPYNGWIPVLVGDQKWYSTLCTRDIYDSIPSLRSCLDIKGPLSISFGAVSEEIGKMVGFQTKYALFVSAVSISSIIETVKNRILDWAILLEENGIVGEELSFTEREKEIAVKLPQIVSYVNNFYGDTSNAQIQQGTYDSEQEQN